VARTVLKTSGRGDSLAEFNRALRFAVTWRKRSQGTVTEKGSRWVERILSLKETCRLQARSTYAVLVDAVRCSFHGQLPDTAWL
jgi:transposase